MCFACASPLLYLCVFNARTEGQGRAGLHAWTRVLQQRPHQANSITLVDDSVGRRERRGASEGTPGSRRLHRRYQRRPRSPPRLKASAERSICFFFFFFFPAQLLTACLRYEKGSESRTVKARPEREDGVIWISDELASDSDAKLKKQTKTKQQQSKSNS